MTFGDDGKRKGPALNFDKQQQQPSAVTDSAVDTVGQPGKGTLTADPLPRTTRDAHAPASTIFLSPATRANLLQLVGEHIVQACSNFNLAVTEVNFAQLMAKGSDLPWVLGLLLDVVGGHLAKQLGSAVRALRDNESECLAQLALDLGEGASWRMRAYAGFVAMTDGALAPYFEAAFSVAKKRVSGAVEKLKEDPSEKAQTSAYLDELRNHTDVSFEALRVRLPDTSDAELVSLRETFAVRHNFVDAYREALKAKIERFKASGVAQIRRYGGHPLGTIDDAPRGDGGWEFHDVGGYLVWRNYVSGRRELIVQSGGRSDPAKPSDQRHGGTDGVSVPKDDMDMFPERVVVVPVEFQAAAIAKHVETWHTQPMIEPQPYDDSGYYWDPERAAAAKRKKAAAVLPAGRPDVVIPDALRMKP